MNGLAIFFAIIMVFGAIISLAALNPWLGGMALFAAFGVLSKM